MATARTYPADAAADGAIADSLAETYTTMAPTLTALLAGELQETLGPNAELVAAADRQAHLCSAIAGRDIRRGIRNAASTSSRRPARSRSGACLPLTVLPAAPAEPPDERDKQRGHQQELHGSSVPGIDRGRSATRRLGGGPSNRLVDAIVVRSTPEQTTVRVRQQLHAGSGHVRVWDRALRVVRFVAPMW